MRRLALRLPTVLQISATHAILFHEHGVSELTQLGDTSCYAKLKFPLRDCSHRIWALINSGVALKEPVTIFMIGSPFFMVNAVAPGSQQLDGWFKKVGYQRFYMAPWSLSEVIQACVGPVSRRSRHSHHPQSQIL